MFKNKLNYKLLNILLFISIIYLFYKIYGLLIIVGNKFFEIMFPFFISFTIAYSLNPILQFLERKNISRKISITLIIGTIILLLLIFLKLIIPMLFNQVTNLFNTLIVFIIEMSMKYDIDFGPLQNTLTSIFNKFLKNIGLLILPLITKSFSYISIIMIIFILSIYLLIDMEKIRNKFKYFCISKNIYKYFKQLDISMYKYLEGFTKIIIITLIEYSFTFIIIGHPNAILLGVLAAISNLIPYFGSLIVNIIASITAFVISPKLFIRTLILFLILSIVDSYIINPYIYGNTNKLHPVIIIFSTFTGGILFGLIGIILSLPITILIITTISYYKNEINHNINNIF